MSELLKSKEGVILPISLFVLTVITRIPFTSKLLYHMDSVQYALALKKYDITVHQPHPPGYFLYVMLGRLLNLLIGDANITFVFISIIASGFTVVILYYLGKNMFDKRTAIFAAVMAIVSPNFWFHGEVALNYSLEAFFSALIAALCWKIINGKEGYLWLSAITLAVAGGVRQNTLVFLLPLWVFTVWRLRFWKVAMATCVIAAISLAWFSLMIQMTGGIKPYVSSLRDISLGAVRQYSVFENGLAALKMNSLVLFNFIVYDIGGAVVFFVFCFYHLVRSGRISSLKGGKAAFFLLWSLPSFLFYLLIAIAPSVPGYALIFLPPLLLVSSRGIIYFIDEIRFMTGRNVSVPLIISLVFANLYMFFFATFNVSYPMIKEHDRSLTYIYDRLRVFDPSNTVLFVSYNYIFYGLSQAIYYLPEFISCEPADFPPGTKRFTGVSGKTILIDEIALPAETQNFVTLIYPAQIDVDRVKKSGLSVQYVFMDILSPMYIISGPISKIEDIYPYLKYKFVRNSAGIQGGS